ncbi:insulinase family protein [Paraglaciecola aquimarina]|uniref:Protease 3 n=1 Tax=Paraglaciecola algarum TaxID=3050085 RepID=A0ABS9D9M1_9ALTE|nr:insulinase family protein [Paraglaciecola sp. G1-23]MCF2949666.1 insulinase family protein [Paraglaciecola sp. G1-23]
MGLFNPRRISYLVFVISFTIFSGCQSQKFQLVSDQPLAKSSIVKSPNDKREYASITLPNQLELVLVSDPTIEKSAAAISVGAGSYQEPKGFGGLAHYLEHMLFMGTKTFPEVNGYGDFVSRNGGTQNAYTDLEHTNYLVAVNNNAFDEALARFSGFFYEASLDENYADKERNAVHSEWTMKSPNDWVILQQLNGLTLNPAHPVSQFNWGNLESLTDKKDKTLHAALEEFYQKYYSANLMKGALVSHLSIAEMKLLAYKHFAHIPNKNIPRPTQVKPAAKPEHLNKIVHYLPQTDMKQIQLKFVIDNNVDQFAVKPNGYVNYLLANEMPGTLASELRNAGLSEAVYADYDADLYGNTGDLTLYIDLTEEGLNNRDKVMAAALKYLALLREEGVNQKYFKEIQQSLQNEFRFQEQISDFDYAMQIAADLQTGTAEYVLSRPYEYQRFNPQVIQQVLDQLTLENARVFYIDKEQKTNKSMQFFLGQYAVTEISVKHKQKWVELSKEFNLQLPRENGLMPSKFDLVPAVYTAKPTQIIQQPGYSSHLAHSALFQKPKGRIKIELNTEVAKKSAKNHVLASILSSILNQQITELQSEAMTAGMNLQINTDKGLSIGISGFSHQQTELLDRTLDLIKHLTIGQSELLNSIASFESELHSRKKNILLNQLFPKFRQVLNLDNYSDKALLAEVTAITVDELIDYKDQILKRAYLQVFSFGNYTEEQAKIFGDLVLKVLPEDRQFSEIYLSPELNVAAGDIFSWQEDVSMDDIAMVDTYMKALNIKDLAAAQLLNEIINPALFNQIRTEEQLAYSVGFFSQRIKEQLLLGYYIQSPAKGLAEVQERIKSFRQSFLDKLKILPKLGFEDYKTSLLNTLKQPAKNLAEEQGQYLADWRLQNWLFDSKEQLIQQVELVSIEQVIDLYQQIEKNQRFGRLLVQLRGNKFIDEPFIQPDGVTIIQDIESFHAAQNNKKSN